MAADLEPIPYTGTHSEDDLELFGAYDRLVPIIVEGARYYVPPGLSALRGCQYLEMKHRAVRMPWRDYCWNNTKGCCEMTMRAAEGEAPRVARACTVAVTAGLEIVKLPKGGRRCTPRGS